MKKDRAIFSRVSDLFTGLLIVSFIAWKLSLILTHWTTAKKTLISILYLTGGWINFTAAGLCGALYLFFKYRRKKASAGEIRMLLLLLVLTGASALPIHFTALKMAGSQESQRDAPGNSIILLEDLSGAEKALTLTGRDRTIVNFWATWCPPCRAELPELIRYEKDHDPEKVRFVTVNMTSTEKSLDEVLAFIKKEPVELAVLLDKNGAAAGAFGINSVPTTLVFDSDGKLLDYRTCAVDFNWLRRAGKVP